MKTIRLIILVALIAIPNSSLAASRGRAAVGRSGFVRPPFAHGMVSPRPFFPFRSRFIVIVRPPFAHRVVFPRPFFPFRSRFIVIGQPPFAHRIIFPQAFFLFPSVYSYSQPYAYSPYSYGDYTAPYNMNYSAQSYPISPPPPPADAYDRGYSEGYAQ